MKIASHPILLYSCVILGAPCALAQTTYYSPGGVGTVSTANVNANGTISNSIFAWDLNATSTATTNDVYNGGGSSTLSITTGEFRVILGTNVNLGATFWDTEKNWLNIITKSGSSIIPTLTTGLVSAYTYSGSTYTPVNTSANGQFSISGSSTAGYSVKWTAVPEPTSALAGCLLAAGLLRRKRR